MPLVNPVTVNGEPAPVAVRPPGLLVTVKPVIGEPPVLAGGVKLTVAWVFPAVAVTAVGAPGAVAGGGAAGVMLLLGSLAGLVPIAFVAVTVKV